MTNDTFAVQAFRYFWKESDLSKISVTDFDRALAMYRAQGIQWNRLGELVRTTELPRVKTAMEKLAESSGSKFPLMIEFLDAIGAEATKVTPSQVVRAIGEGVAEAGNVAFSLGKSSIMIYVAIAAVGMFILPNLPKLIPELRKLIK